MCRWIRRRRSLADTRGQALVEFAFAIPIVLILMAGTFELGHYFYTKITIRHAVLEATRFAVTGRQLEDEDDQGEYLTRAESIREMIRRNALHVDVELQNVSITPPDGGGPGDVVRVSAEYNYLFSLPLIREFFPSSGIDFSVSTAMKNEPKF